MALFCEMKKILKASVSLSARELGVAFDFLALLDSLFFLLHNPVLALHRSAVGLVGAAHLTSVPAHHLHAHRSCTTACTQRSRHLLSTQKNTHKKSDFICCIYAHNTHPQCQHNNDGYILK